MRFRKLPVEIEAVQVPESKESLGWGDLAIWLFDSSGEREWEVGDIDGKTGVSIKTLEGTMFANPGDWIIKGVAGEIYPCKPDIFDQTYEAVE